MCCDADWLCRYSTAPILVASFSSNREFIRFRDAIHQSSIECTHVYSRVAPSVGRRKNLALRASRAEWCLDYNDLDSFSSRSLRTSHFILSLVRSSRSALCTRHSSRSSVAISVPVLPVREASRASCLHRRPERGPCSWYISRERCRPLQPRLLVLASGGAGASHTPHISYHRTYHRV